MWIWGIQLFSHTPKYQLQIIICKECEYCDRKSMKKRELGFSLHIVLKYLLRNLIFWLCVLMNYWLKRNVQILNNNIGNHRLGKAEVSNKWYQRFTRFRCRIRLSKYRVGIFWHPTETSMKLKCLHGNSKEEGVRIE